AITSNRVSFLLGIMGPSTSIDCTSTAAVVGGVYLCLTPFMWPRWEAFMNPAGRCFSFDNAARGYVDGSIVVSDDPYVGSLALFEVGTMVGWSMANSGRNAGDKDRCLAWLGKAGAGGQTKNRIMDHAEFAKFITST
ncbi:PKS40, partial [Symbiodinium microadriaticum]